MDGTTKFGKHYVTYDTNGAGFSYSLDVRHMFSGSTQRIPWKHLKKF